MDPSFSIDLKTITGIVALTIALVHYLKGWLASVPLLEKVPVAAYVVLVSCGLTWLSHDVLHLIIRQVPKTRGDNHQICRVKRFKPRNIGLDIWIDEPRGGVDREQHCTVEAVPVMKDARQLRQRLLRPVLFVTTDQHDLLTASEQGDGEEPGKQNAHLTYPQQGW